MVDCRNLADLDVSRVRSERCVSIGRSMQHGAIAGCPAAYTELGRPKQYNNLLQLQDISPKKGENKNRKRLDGNRGGRAPSCTISSMAPSCAPFPVLETVIMQTAVNQPLSDE